MMAGLQSTRLELGGDSDMMRGMFWRRTRPDTHGDERGVRHRGRKDSEMGTYFEKSCGIG